MKPRTEKIEYLSLLLGLNKDGTRYIKKIEYYDAYDKLSEEDQREMLNYALDAFQDKYEDGKKKLGVPVSGGKICDTTQ